MVAVLDGPRWIEAQLAAGRIACPDCSGPLARWGFAAPREIRTRDGSRTLRPRRAICRACGRTHVLLVSWSLARRRDCAQVIGAALEAGARGVGHRRIARDLDRPAGTVRGWLRRARRNGEAIRASAIGWAYALDCELAAVEPAGSVLGDVVEAVATAVRGWVLRLGAARAGPWELAVWMTGGLLGDSPLRQAP